MKFRARGKKVSGIISKPSKRWRATFKREKTEKEKEKKIKNPLVLD
jgi:hypothetical protein